MPKLGKLNLDSIRGPELIPAGKYIARLVDVEDMVSQSGKDMWKWSWDIVSGEHAGRSIMSFTIVQQGENLISLKQHLEAFGFKGDISGVDTDKLLGKTAVLIVVKGKRKDRNGGPDIETSNVNNVLEYKKAGVKAQAAPADDEDEDEDAPAPQAAKKPAPAPVADDDEDEDAPQVTNASEGQSDDDEKPASKKGKKQAPVEEDEDDELPVL